MFREFLSLGGALMWPLFACSILFGAVLIERVWVIGISHCLLRRQLDLPRRTWHRRVLPFFTDVPPSLGLLGTVVGVVRSFHLMDGRLTSEAVGAGLAMACVTTIFGLGIGIAASVTGYLCDWATGATETRPC